VRWWLTMPPTAFLLMLTTIRRPAIVAFAGLIASVISC
jgi:hypothetical protein